MVVMIYKFALKIYEVSIKIRVGMRQMSTDSTETTQSGGFLTWAKHSLENLDLR